MQFNVSVQEGEEWADAALVAGPANRYLRTAMVVAFQIPSPFRIETDDGLLAQGDAGDFIVLDNGIPRVETFQNFGPIHTPLLDDLGDPIERVRVAMERVIAKHVEFEDDQGAGELAEAILGVIATIEVPL